MRILKTYEDAMQVVTECLEKRVVAKRPALAGYGMRSLPHEVDGPWEMTPESAQRTLNYIFNVIHHTCYILCVTNSVPELFKIEPPGIPAYYESAIRKTLKQKSKLAKTLKNKPLRVMQCVIKPRKAQSETSQEYERFIGQLEYTLPNGVYILNLTDAVILRRDGRNPWDPPSQNLSQTKLDKYLPILGGSGAVGYLDVPMPNYDDVRIALGYDRIPNYETDWSAKKNVVVFRGGPTGCGTTSRTNMRLRVAEMKSPTLDVGLVRVGSPNPKFDPERGISFIETGVQPVPRVSMEEQSKYKYILHIDGNVAAYRLLNTMLTGSLILKVKGVYTLWTDHILEDGVHYVSVKEDLSNLNQVFDWCTANQAKCKSIAKKGKEFAEKALTLSYLSASFAKLLWTIKKFT
jgi:hypothetical protein